MGFLLSPAKDELRSRDVRSDIGRTQGSLQISICRVRALLLVMAAAIVAVSLVFDILRTVHGDVVGDRLFIVYEEANIASWFTSMLLLVSAQLLAGIAFVRARERQTHVLPWFVLALIFVGMSLEEITDLHVYAMFPLRQALNLSGLFYFSWVIVALPVVAVIGAMYVPFLLRLPRQTCRSFILAGALYVGGALGVEMLIGPVWESVGKQHIATLLMSHVEEAMEMIGIVVFISALLGYIASQWAGLRIEPVDPNRSATGAMPASV
jgi:hypothetical protein